VLASHSPFTILKRPNNFQNAAKAKRRRDCFFENICRKLLHLKVFENYVVCKHQCVFNRLKPTQRDRIAVRKTNRIAARDQILLRARLVCVASGKFGRRRRMSTKITALVATAVLFGGTAFAAAQSDTYQNGKNQASRNAAQNGRDQISRNAATDRAARRDWNNRDSYAGNYMDNGQNGWRSPAAGYYDFAPGQGAYYSNGPGGYYDSAYWRGVQDVTPSFSPGPDPYAGTYFYGVAPW
jgi:hypothetical protein